MGMCDVCEKKVEYKDDASVIEAIAYDKPAAAFISNPRHINCSPSRAQYIVHEDFGPIVDERESYDKRLLPEAMRRKREQLYTDAFVILQNEERK
mgnify:CR=1 FL=1